MEPERDIAGQDRRASGQIARLATHDPLVRGQRDERFLEPAHARLERARELELLAADDGQDLVTTLREVGVRVGHRLDDHLGGLDHERLGAPQEPAMPDRSAEDPAQHVAAALVRGCDAVADDERHRARVVGDDLVAEALRLERVGVVAEELAHPRVDGHEQVGVVVRVDLLDDARHALEAHARVDARGRQRRQRPVGMELELHEHEVPDLEPARAVLRVVGHALRALGQVSAAVVVELRARAARPDVGHPPPVLLVALLEVAPADEALGRQADLVAPDVVGEVVGRVGRRRKPLRRDPEVTRQELPGPVDRLALEVVAEAPVAEHLEQRVMPRRPADLLEVVVLPGDPEAALEVHRAGVVALLDAGQDVLERDHPGVHEQERLVTGGDERRAGHDRVAALHEELEEPGADVGSGQPRDALVPFDRGGRHRRHRSERRMLARGAADHHRGCSGTAQRTATNAPLRSSHDQIGRAS